MSKNAVATIDQATKEIDTVVEECLPITSQQTQSFGQALVLAKGVKTLRNLFLTPEIKETVESMANTPLGFMTDRSPAAIESSKRTDLQPYTYDEIKECCIEAMLKGYRITNNEFNIIASRFYPAKDGKYRKIIEDERVSNFKFTHTPPLFCVEDRIEYGKPKQIQIAKVQCYASWHQDGGEVKLGYGEDKLVFKIKVNAFMGDDGVVGKALSKLFSRVLMRLEGRMVPDSDIDDSQTVDVSPGKETEDTTLGEKLSRANTNGATQTQRTTKQPQEAQPDMSNKDWEAPFIDLSDKFPIAFKMAQDAIGEPSPDNFNQFKSKVNEILDHEADAGN